MSSFKWIALIIGLTSKASLAIDIHSCIEQASITHGVDAKLIWSIKIKESGTSIHAGISRVNDDGSEDLGPMQVNTVWLPYLSERGFSREKLLGDGCEGIKAGTLILSEKISQYGLYEGIGRYHSATPKFKLPYRDDVLAIWKNLKGGAIPEDLSPKSTATKKARSKHRNPFTIAFLD